MGLLLILSVFTIIKVSIKCFRKFNYSFLLSTLFLGIIDYKSEETKPREIQDNKIEVSVNKVQQTQAQERLLNDEINCEAIG